jgi:cysteine desulfurase
MSLSSPIYLDNNATTRIAPEVLSAMTPFFTEHYGNPSSAYELATPARSAVNQAREQVAALLHCDPAHLIFTSCGTESDNAALWSALQTTGKKHIVTSQVEHSAIHKYCEHLEMKGYSVTWLPVAADGTLDPAQVEEAIHEGTAIVSLMWANNETGVLFPVSEISEICRRRGVLFHTDAVQCPGKIPLTLDTIPVDFLSLSAHKIHAPKGIGALYIRPGVRYQPWLIGGSQERERRGGTENVPAIVGFGRAAELAQHTFLHEQTRVRDLRDHFENELRRRVPQATVNGHPHHRLPNTSSICFGTIDGRALHQKLNREGLYVATGSACTSAVTTPSHVLVSMGLSEAQTRASLRFSLSHETTAAEIERTLEIVPRCLASLTN